MRAIAELKPPLSYRFTRHGMRLSSGRRQFPRFANQERPELFQSMDLTITPVSGRLYFHNDRVKRSQAFVDYAAVSLHE
jgi:hypothetical protein